MKFDMFTDWEISTLESGLHSFGGLVMVYHRYATYSEMCIKSLRLLIKLYFRTDIPVITWTQGLIELFNSIKVCITSSPVLTDTTQISLYFFKIGRSTEWMG